MAFERQPFQHRSASIRTDLQAKLGALLGKSSEDIALRLVAVEQASMLRISQGSNRLFLVHNLWYRLGLQLQIKLYDCLIVQSGCLVFKRPPKMLLLQIAGDQFCTCQSPFEL
jgi:hypothetical protein